MDFREKQEKEAEKRLEMLGLDRSVCDQYQKDRTVFFSERRKLGSHDIGVLYWVHNEQRFVDAIKNFENETGSLVYHVIHDYTSFGELLTLLFVSKYEEEWKRDNKALNTSKKTWEIMSYVVNMTDEWLSEFGYVDVREAYGGLIRIV